LVKNETRLANSENFKLEKKENINVPEDYATIQEAVNNAGEFADITVESGIYEEQIVIITRGIKIEAKKLGEIILNGGFVINADDVSIEGFTINLIRGDVPERTFISAIGALNVKGLTLENNTIVNINNEIRTYGIYSSGVSNSSFENNNISNAGTGMLLSSSGVDLDNQIKSFENTVSGNQIYDCGSGGLKLFGDIDYHLIIGNKFSNNRNPDIWISGSSTRGYGDYNQIKGNRSKNSNNGISLSEIGDFNEITNNEFLNHQYHGISLYTLNSLSKGNIIKNNKAFGNGTDYGKCDIYLNEAWVLLNPIEESDNKSGCFELFTPCEWWECGF
jgi:parallel beta-helix repeat protein